MKFELNVVRFDASDVVTTSGCAKPAVFYPAGNKPCPAGVAMPK